MFFGSRQSEYPVGSLDDDFKSRKGEEGLEY